MAITRPFAFNSGTTISGTTQVGNIAIGVDQVDYSGNPGYGGVTWISGPDEENTNIICINYNNDQLKFYGGNDFALLVNRAFKQNFLNNYSAYNWLTSQEYWTNNIFYYIGLLAAGSNHTLFISETSNWSWGYNIRGQLGDNSNSNRCTPVSILGSKKTFCNITAGDYHTVGVDHLGQVWGWGYNNRGQLGDNSVTSRLTPVSILGSKKTFCNITAGQYHTVGVDYLGQVWSWGYNGYGQLGDNSVTSRLTPVSILGGKKTFCKITAGGYFLINHTVGVDLRGQVWCWGYNAQGQLGDNSVTSRRTPVSILGSKKTFCNITAGYSHTIGVDYLGQVWGWGYNAQGQLGDNSVTSRRTPVSILGSKKTFCNITAGQSHTVGVDYLGQVWSWGYNNYGQLGDNSVTSRLTPVSILGSKKTFCNITAGDYHTIGVDYLGQVWGWGYNGYGQLGDNSVTSRLTPVSILGGKKTFCKITAGGYHTVGVDLRGQVWGWGYNLYGRLGDNSVTSRRTPVSILGSKKTFCNITAGYSHTIGVDYLGQVWSWGYNAQGQLGDNSVTSRRTPVSILGSKKTFCNITAGQSHTVGVDYLGQVWSWGYNNYGQLGDNSVTSRLTPVSILGSKKTFCNITAGDYHTVGVDYLGQVWCWGYNAQGQLGDNSVTSRRTPVSILGGKKTFCKITAGGYHTVGVDLRGQVWGWGYNNRGQLGDNSVTSRLTPVSILGSKKTFCNITAGYSHTIGVDYLGQVWSWGYNYYGQLGDNSVTSRLTPVSILGSKKTFCNITAGYYHTIGVDYLGQVWGWGYNIYGQLGIHNDKYTPVRVYNL